MAITINEIPLLLLFFPFVWWTTTAAVSFKGIHTIGHLIRDTKEQHSKGSTYVRLNDALLAIKNWSTVLKGTTLLWSQVVPNF